MVSGVVILVGVFGENARLLQWLVFCSLLSDIMDLRNQSSAMCIIMLGGEDTHPWSATKVGNPIPATIPVDQ